MNQLLKAEEVARLLGVSTRRAWLLGRRGVIPVVRLGERQVRFPTAALNAWIERGGMRDSIPADEGAEEPPE